MKKKICLMINIFIVILLSSCHGTLIPLKEKVELIDFEVPQEFDTTKEYNVTFWAKNDTNKYQQEIYLKAKEDFENIYPNIHIDIVQYNDYTKIYSDVITNISTNTTPNISIAYPDHVATYMEGKGVIVPLDNLINDINYGLGGKKIKFNSVKKEDINSIYLDECIIQNKYTTLPFMRSSEALYVNKTYLINNGFEIPEVFTWEYIWEVSKYAKNKNPNMIPLIYKSTDNMFISLCKQNKYEFTDDFGQVYFLSDNVSNMLLDLVGPINEGLFDTFKRISYPANFFNKEECIFAIDSTAGSTWMGSKAPLLDIPETEVKQFETIVTTVPQISNDNISMISQGPSICLFYKDDPNEVLASWLFMQYLLTDDVQFSYSKTEGYLPVTNRVVNSKAFNDYLADENEYDIKRYATKLIIDNMDYMFVTSVFNGSSLCRSAAGYLIEAIFNSKYQTKKGIKELFKVVNNRYKLNTYRIS